MDGDAETKDGTILSDKPLTIKLHYGIHCPFCGEDGFDKAGLKNHFERGWCKPYTAQDTD